MKTDKLYFGTAYYYEYLPFDRIEQDMTMMEQAGMNTIRIAESTWSTLEPHDGVFDFAHIDQMLTSAAGHRISVIVGTPTYAVPSWLVRKYPDILAVTAGGRELYGRRQNMDITHPQYRYYAERMIRALMEHIKNVPHIIGFQLDNETKSYGTAGPRVQSMFVEYLKEQFYDLKEFNHEFGLDYWSNRVNDWDDFPDVRGTINQSLSAEFMKFQRSLVTEFLNWQAKIVREYLRDGQFLTQNFDFDWRGYSFGYQSEVDQYEAAGCLTVAGADIYHPSQGDLTGAEITVCGNIARGLKKDNYLVLETQAQGRTEWLPYPGQLILQAYSHIANGSNSVMYWHWHSIHNAIESYWKGVLSHDFSENETYREAASIGLEFKRIGAHLANLTKENKVAVLLDNASLSGLKLFPLETTGDHSYNIVMRFLADSLYRLNVEYDMISSDERDFSRYDCILLPALYSAPEDLLTALHNYVKNGGHLIAALRTGFSDEHLKIYSDTQPHILHECLGLHYDQFTFPHNVTVSLPNKSALNGAAHDWMELITLDTASPVAVYDHPVWNRYTAVAKNQFGKGSTLYIASLFPEDMLDDILSDYLTTHSICDLDCVPRFPVIIKKGMNSFGKKLCYYLNFSDVSQKIIHNGKEGVELRTNTTIAYKETLTLAPWGAAVIEM